MFASSSLCPVHDPNRSNSMGLPGLGNLPPSGGLAMDRLPMPGGVQSLGVWAPPTLPTGPSLPTLQAQQLLQLMGLLLSLMQNRGQGQQAASTGTDAIGASGSQGGSQAIDTGGSQVSGVESAQAGSANGSTVTRQGKPIGAHIAKQFDSMVAAAKQGGINITITSGARSRAEQERLYAAYKNGTGNLAAKPGTSNHESGDALDLGPPAAYAWLKQNAGRFGFKNKIASEPWHWSLTGN